jgi:hypothetical protein
MAYICQTFYPVTLESYPSRCGIEWKTAGTRLNRKNLPRGGWESESNEASADVFLGFLFSVWDTRLKGSSLLRHLFARMLGS